jgi:hypothetical protein
VNETTFDVAFAMRVASSMIALSPVGSIRGVPVGHREEPVLRLARVVQVAEEPDAHLGFREDPADGGLARSVVVEVATDVLALEAKRHGSRRYGSIALRVGNTRFTAERLGSLVAEAASVTGGLFISRGLYGRGKT